MIVAGRTITHRHLRDVALLLWSWMDLRYEPPTGTGQITKKSGAKRVAESDTAPTYTTRCDACDKGNGPWWRDRGQLTNRCQVCGGSGRRSWPRTEQPDTDTEPVDVDQVTRALDRRAKAGPYFQLELALAGLTKHVNKPREFVDLDGARAKRLLLEHYVQTGDQAEVPTEPSDDRDREQVRLGLTYLAWSILARTGKLEIHVPGEVRRARVAREHWYQATRYTRGDARKARDREIKRLHREQGWQVPALAQRFGLKRAQVYEILFGRKSAA